MQNSIHEISCTGACVGVGAVVAVVVSVEDVDGIGSPCSVWMCNVDVKEERVGRGGVGVLMMDIRGGFPHKRAHVLLPPEEFSVRSAR